MRAIAILGMVALSCAGCVLKSDEPRGAGEVSEGLANYFEDFAVSDSKRVGPTTFHVAQGGTVDAEISTTWKGKAGYSCKGGLAILILKKMSPPIDTIGGKSFLAGYAKQKRTWNGLGAGNYDLTLDAMNDNPNCTLSGHVDITVKP